MSDMLGSGIIFVKELMRCGGIYLFKYDCHGCKDEILSGEKLSWCHNCGFGYGDYVLDVSKVRIKRNLVAQAINKNRRGINNNTARAVFDSQDWKCIYCQCDLREGQIQAEIDHIYPLSAGGRSHISNYVGACNLCNRIASDKIFPNLASKIEWVLEMRMNKRSTRRKNK